MNYLEQFCVGGGPRLIALLLVFALVGTAYGQDDPVQILYWDQVYGNETQEAGDGHRADHRQL